MDAELELDSLLEDYLVAIDHYSLAQAALAANLKSAHFDLAKAKLVLGPTRVGEASYDLAETDARVAVSIESDTTSARVSLSLGPSASRPAPNPSTSTLFLPSTLRQRQPASGGDGPLPTPPASPLPTSADDEAPPAPRDPIFQFAVWPPPVLKSSQAAFSNALRNAVEVVERREHMYALERRVREVKGRIASGRSIGEDGGEVKEK